MGRRGDALGLDLYVRRWRLVPAPFRINRGGVVREGTRWEAVPEFIEYRKSADWPEGVYRTKTQAKAEAKARGTTIDRTDDTVARKGREAPLRWWAGERAATAQ